MSKGEANNLLFEGCDGCFQLQVVTWFLWIHMYEFMLKVKLYIISKHVHSQLHIGRIEGTIVEITEGKRSESCSLLILSNRWSLVLNFSYVSSISLGILFFASLHAILLWFSSAGITYKAPSILCTMHLVFTKKKSYWKNRQVDPHFMPWRVNSGTYKSEIITFWNILWFHWVPLQHISSYKVGIKVYSLWVYYLWYSKTLSRWLACTTLLIPHLHFYECKAMLITVNRVVCPCGLAISDSSLEAKGPGFPFL